MGIAKDVIRVGRIDFLNTLPFFCSEGKRTPLSGASLVPGTPAGLNGKLVSGEIDASIASSLLYAAHPEKFLILPDLCIGASGKSNSVILFSREPLESLGGKTIALSPKSLSAVSLLKILLALRWKIPCNWVPCPMATLEMAEHFPAFLLIGDDALFLNPRPAFVYDLSELWREWTGLPFCFALWQVRRSFSEMHPERVRIFCEELNANLRAGLSDPDRLIRGYPFPSEGDRRFAAGYLRNLEYHLSREMRQGLELFYEYAAEIGLIPEAPELLFFEDRSSLPKGAFLSELGKRS